MEPDVMPLHVSAPAPVYDDGGERVPEEDEFGEFGGFTDSTEPSPHLRQPPPATKPASRGPPRSLSPASSAESAHFTNGYAKRPPDPAAGAASPREETGFADFTVFAEQAAHPWCCGFSPTGDVEQWGDGAGAAGRPGAAPGAERQTIMDSEPRPHCAREGGQRGCATVKHCAESMAALVHSSQDHHHHHHHSQEAAPHPGEGEGTRRGSADSFKTLELQDSRDAEEEEAERTVEFEDSASLFDNVSFEGPSEDFEPNVSSLGSPGDQTDAEEEEEELGDDGVSDSSAARQFPRPATQETSATSSRFADFNHGTFEHRENDDGSPAADGGPRILGGLPPSDSFADFCSAPAQEDGGETWAEFREQRVEEEEEEDEEEPSGLQTEEGEHGASSRRSSQASLCCRVQQLLQTTFPESGVSPVEGEEMVPGLAALLCTQHPPESEEETPPLCTRAQWIQQGFWWPHQDAHSALSLKFQWGGSHTNRILLSCLGVDTRNIVFMGTKKQPVSVPVFASSLGMLEPTKDSAPVVGSPGRAAVGSQAPPGPADARGPSTDSAQALSPGRRDGSSRCLSSSQDDCSVLDLDYFGPEEASGSSGGSSSSSRSNTPPPGVDRELYQLTISKVDSGIDSSRLEETWKRLMSTAERTSTSVRKPQREAELSAEAGMLISGLPNLSFMQARVLMFPSVLAPTE